MGNCLHASQLEDMKRHTDDSKALQKDQQELIQLYSDQCQSKQRMIEDNRNEYEHAVSKAVARGDGALTHEEEAFLMRLDRLHEQYKHQYDLLTNKLSYHAMRYDKIVFADTVYQATLKEKSIMDRIKKSGGKRYDVAQADRLQEEGEAIVEDLDEFATAGSRSSPVVGLVGDAIAVSDDDLRKKIRSDLEAARVRGQMASAPTASAVLKNASVSSPSSYSPVPTTKLTSVLPASGPP